jgi:hypothetical protein
MAAVVEQPTQQAAVATVATMAAVVEQAVATVAAEAAAAIAVTAVTAMAAMTSEDRAVLTHQGHANQGAKQRNPKHQSTIHSLLLQSKR